MYFPLGEDYQPHESDSVMVKVGVFFGYCGVADTAQRPVRMGLAGFPCANSRELSNRLLGFGLPFSMLVHLHPKYDR